MLLEQKMARSSKFTGRMSSSKSENSLIQNSYRYGYNGKSGSGRGRSQKTATKIPKQSETFFSTVCQQSAAPARHVTATVTTVCAVKRSKDPIKSEKSQTALDTSGSGEPQSLKMLQELLNVDPKTQERQLGVCKLSNEYHEDPIDRSYLYLGEIKDTNEKLYFTLLGQYIDQYLPIVKTPVVTTPCKNFGIVYKKHKSVFINIHDKGHIYDLLMKWPKHEIKAVIVTENGRLLGQKGVGDPSAFGMGIPMSKLALYTALAGIKPHQCLPITLDVGTDNLVLLQDPTYTGLKERRVESDVYDEFIDEFMDACVQRFGPHTLVQEKGPVSPAVSTDISTAIWIYF